MSYESAEQDWRILRQLEPVALERHCQATLERIAQIASDKTKNYHERYRAIWRVMQERDDEVVETFDDMRRSRALMRICALRTHRLLTEEEFARFSEQTRSAVEAIVGVK